MDRIWSLFCDLRVALPPMQEQVKLMPGIIPSHKIDLWLTTKDSIGWKWHGGLGF